jgi:hypothetical protein
MERAAARSGPSSKMLEWGRRESVDLFFFMAEILAGDGSVGKPQRFGLKNVVVPKCGGGVAAPPPRSQHKLRICSSSYLDGNII